VIKYSIIIYGDFIEKAKGKRNNFSGYTPDVFVNQKVYHCDHVKVYHP
jgi:hypothetical protein